MLSAVFGSSAMLLLGALPLAHLRNVPWALIGGTAAVLLITQAFFIAAYGKSPDGRSELRPFAAEIERRFPDALIYNPQNGRKNLPGELSIYLDRPLIRWEQDVRELPPLSRPQIVIFESGSSRLAAPPGFTAVATGKIKDRHFHAFVRDPVMGEQPAD